MFSDSKQPYVVAIVQRCEHTNIYIRTQSCLLESEDDTYTHSYPPGILRAQTHIHLGARLFLAISRRASITYTTNSNLSDDRYTFTHPYSCPRLIACTNTHFSFTFTEAFPLHACSITSNFRSYFTVVGRVYLVETIILQTLL